MSRAMAPTPTSRIDHFKKPHTVNASSTYLPTKVTRKGVSSHA
jgi:hypothetical protein